MSTITIDPSAKGDHDTNNKPSSTITSDTVIMKKSLLSNNSRNNTSQHFNFPGLKIPTGGFKMPSSSSSSSGGEVAAKARAAARVAARAALNVVIGIGNEVYSTEEEELDNADDVAAEATPQEEKEKEEEETKKKQEEEEKEYKKAVEKLRALEELRSEMNTSYHSSSMVSTSSQEDTLEEEENVTTRTVSLPTVENATVVIAAPLRQEQEEQAYVPHKKTKTTTITNDDFINNNNNNNNNNSATVVDLDEIDLDKITVHDLQGLTADDGDILRAKHLNKLSRVEREHVLQDIHGVAEFPIMDNNFIDASLKKISIELKSELLSRQKNNTLNNSAHTVPPPQAQQEEATQSQPAALPVLEEKLGELQRKLKELVGCRSNSNDSSYQGNVFKMDCPSSVQRNHNLHNIGGATSIPSGLFSNFNSSNNVPSTTTRATGTNTKTKATTAIEDEALQDDAILKSSKAAAYEQALAQCRGRRRERRSSLFRHNALYGNLYQDEDEDNNDDYDSTRYLDVESRDFLLSFLRCERFDYKKAALRIFDYFEEKKSLFGLDFLTTRIQLKDLDIETKQYLDSGYIQLLPGRDRAGRAVIVGTKKLIAPYDRDDDNTSALRALWFVSSVALEDAGTETNGVVFVYYALGNGSDASSSPSNHGNDRRLRRIDGWGNILRAIPLRIASIHWCVDTFQDKKVVNLSALMLGASNFVRVRCHAGTDTEVHYDLMTFGIPTSLLPVTMNGNIDLSQHRDFLQQRKQLGATSVLNQALAVIDAPVIDDCIAFVEDDVDGVVKDAAKTNNNNDGGATWDLVDTYFHQQKQAQQQRDNNMTIINNNNNNTNTNDSFMYSRNSNNNSMHNSMDNTMGSMHMMNRPMQVQSHPIQIESGMHHVQEQQQQQQILVNQFQQQQQQRLDQMMHQQQYLSQQHQFQQLQQLQSYGTTTANTSNTKKMKKSKNNDRNDNFSFCREPVLVPREADILLGRGLGVQNRKGNVNYRYVVESFRSRYEKITQKGAKTQLIREVVECIHSKGGRFVKQDSYGRWIPVDPQIARDKVSHSFRNQKRLSLLPDGSDDDIYVNNKNKNKKKRSRNGMKSMTV